MTHAALIRGAEAPSAIVLAGLCVAIALTPALIWPLCFAACGAGAVTLALRLPVPASALWLILTGMTLEMALHDLIGPAMLQTTIAAVKTVGIGLALICALRHGARMEVLNPVWAYAVMLIAGWAHGLYPGLTAADSLRSCLGSVAPFAFCFCRLPSGWPDAIVRATKWVPVLAVLACLPLAMAGLRPLFVDSGGARLAGLGHPAFLAGVCLPAIYACLIEVYRLGRGGDIALLAVNMLILLLTGARAPLAYAVLVAALTLLSVPSGRFSAEQRRLLLLLAGLAAPLLALFAANLTAVRLFNLLETEAADLSGRTLLWPAFQAAAAQSPWVGWGIGAGNWVIPPDGAVARLLHTWAAHNEYLRISVEGGQIGLGLLISLFALWVMRATAPLAVADRRIMRLAFIAFALNAATDNVLISTPACVLITFATAVFRRLPLPDSHLRA